SLKAAGSVEMAVCYNVNHVIYSTIYNIFKERKIDEAQVAQDSIASLRAVFKYGNPNTAVKKAVSLLGYPVGDCRRPFHYLSHEGVKELEKVLKENKEKGMNGSYH